MRICYGKIGRSLILDRDRFGPVGGDNEPLALLLTLADRHPDWEFVIGCRWTGSKEAQAALPSNITLPPVPKVKPRNTYKNGERIYDPTQNPWEAGTEILAPYFEDADGVVMWAGQMGTSNVPIPKLEDINVLTNPQDSFMTYCAPTTLNINRWRDADPQGRQEIWLCADSRNYLKARDLKWPPAPIIGQFDATYEQKHYRWGDEHYPAHYGFEAIWSPGEGNVWLTRHQYHYQGLELVGIPEDWDQRRWDGRRRGFGILINEARAYVGLDRATIVRDWLITQDLIESDEDIRGKWSAPGAEKIKCNPTPIIHHKIPNFLAQYRSTFTTPSSGSGWATTKWHEAARLGTVCFCHPKWDSQGHVVPTIDAVREGIWDHDPAMKHLITWLRPGTPEELAVRVRAVNDSWETYTWLRDMQYHLAEKYKDRMQAVTEIERRLGCTV